MNTSMLPSYFQVATISIIVQQQPNHKMSSWSKKRTFSWEQEQEGGDMLIEEFNRVQ